MISCGPTQSYTIPLKNCQGSVIDHSLVSIRLSVEWPDKAGDNPNLVIHVTNKQPSTLYQSSLPVNSVHPQYQHQENVFLTYPQQQYYHSSTINNHNLSSPTVASTISDHDDVSSTTTSTSVYNSIQPQSQTLTSSTAIEQIKNHLQSGLSPLLQHQQYPPTQHVIQTSSTNMNDSRLNVKMSTFSPRSSIQLLPSMTTQFVDLQQQSPSLKPSPIKSVVCTCPNPTSYHVHNCAIFTSNNQESNTNLLSETQHTTSINRTNTQRCVSASHVPTNSVNLLPSMKESMITTTFLPHSNSNFMNTLDSSSSVTTIISQTPSFLNNPQIGPTIKTPSFDTNNIFQQPSLNVSQVIINNPSNYQTNPPISMPSVGQQNTVTKKRTKQNSLTNQDQTLFQNLNNSQQQIHFLNNQNSPTKQQNINPTHHLSSPIQTQQGMFIHQDNSQITDKTLCGSMNDIVLNTTQQQQSSRLNSMVRSPVKLEISGSQHLNQVKLSPEAAMDQTISDVIKGKGDISIGNSLKSTAPQKHQRPSLSTQLVRESIGPTPTTRTICVPLHQEQQLSTTYDSNISTLSRPNVVDITQQVIRPNSTEENKINTLTKQPAKKNNKKRNQLKSMNNTVSKRTYKSTVNIQQQQQQTIMSSSHQDISQTRTSPVTSTSNIITKQNSWSDTPISSSSSESVTNAHNVNPNRRSTNDSLQTPDIDQDSDLLDFDADMTIIYRNDGSGIELNELFSQKIDEPFVSLTPPPIPSITMLTSIRNSIMKQPSGEKLSNTLLTSTANPADIFDTYFLSDTLYSSVACEENQVTSSVETPPDPQNNHLPQQQHYSSTNLYTDSNRESQTPTLQFTETKPTIVNQMNHNDDVQTPSKRRQQQQQQHTKKFVKTNNKSLKRPSKIIKQQNRPNLIKKQTSTKPSCTRCGLTQLVDITHHEFPKQKRLLFECVSCGNNSIRSNVSADERRRRLAKVAADHLNTVECQFCHKFFHSHNDYLTHLKDDHKSNKPM